MSGNPWTGYCCCVFADWVYDTPPGPSQHDPACHNRAYCCDGHRRWVYGAHHLRPEHDDTCVNSTNAE
jgi:hypothetical protein